jgi:REP element-mobilizing transposase RayT
MSRTALEGFPFGDVEKDELVKIIEKLSRLFFVEVFGFCVMGNHFHLLVQMFPGHHYPDEEIRRRCQAHYGEGFELSDEQVAHFRGKLSSLANYMKEIKQAFSWYYNQRHNRRGTLWGGRYKSVIVENGETLINCLAYIDLNPLRAGLVKRPEDYRWNSLGYHIQTGNRDDFLSFDFGLKEFGVMDATERLTHYRRYVYESGGIQRPDGRSSVTVDEKIVENESQTAFEMSRIRRFRYRTRYFSDSGIIGTKEFVAKNYLRFKDIFQSKHEKKPKPIKGLDSVYSLKRLAEA